VIEEGSRGESQTTIAARLRPSCSTRSPNRKSQVANRNSRSAFTLIEILLAIAILSLGITAVLFMFTVGVQAHRRARDRTQAAMLADTVLNQIRADLVFDRENGGQLPDQYEMADDVIYLVDVRTGERVDYAEHADFPGFTYGVRFVPVFAGTQSAQDLYRVTVTVRWGKPPADPDAPLDPRNSEAFTTIVRRRSF